MTVHPDLAIPATLLMSLFPMAVYCLILAWLNRRPQPLLVGGVWDFVGVLFAGSGILLWAGPAMLATLYQRSVIGESEQPFEEIWQHWWWVWAAYYALVAGGAGLLLWLRRHTTAIYNVQVDAVPQLLATTLQRLGFDFAQNAQHQFLIAPAKSPPAGADPAAITVLPRPIAPPAADAGPQPYSAAVEIDTFASLCHATLHWYDAAPRLRRAIENELRKNLVSARADDNPAALWQLGVSIVLFGAILLSVLFYLLTWFPRHG